jgi:hypothetical protein
LFAPNSRVASFHDILFRRGVKHSLCFLFFS